LIISDFGKNVYIHDTNGRELQTISTDAAGKNIFQYTISAGEDIVFVANDINGVITLDNQGKYLSTLTDPLLSNSYGLCTDGRNLFVCNNSAGSIVQIGQDYKVLGELEKVDRAQSLCFDRDKTRLYVTRQNSNITVLEFE
jgi:DNA-binding beta-propeller fold protein YncE